jgi:serine/threonine-protein kinase
VARISPLGLKVFGFTALVIALALGASLMFVRRVAQPSVDRSIDRALEAALASTQDKLTARSATLRATLQAIATVPSYAASVERALAAGDRGTLLDAANEFRNQVGADWVIITDAYGVLAAWSDRPDQVGVSLAGGALIDQPLQGTPAEGVWLEPGDSGETIYQAVAVPLRAPGRDARLGALVAALHVDTTFAATLKRNTGAEVLFFTRDTTGLPVPNAATLEDGAPLLVAMGRDTTSVRVEGETRSGHWVGTVGTLRSASGTPLAGMAVLRSRSEAMAPYRGLERAIRLSLGVGLLLSLLGSAWLAGRIARPIQALVHATRKVGEGDFTPTPVRESGDEVGELAQAFRKMTLELQEKQLLVDYLGGGRLRTQQASGPRGGLNQGTVLAGRYELREQLGAGGMGIVYRAWDRELQETVALKTLHPALPLGDPDILERFKQEIRLARRITHRNVVRTHDLGESNGVHFITMELVEGSGLDSIMSGRRALPLKIVLPIVRQVLRGLEAAHEVGVIHRDVKPGNVLVQPSGAVKVMDFGIARLAERRGAGASLTAAGAVIGSIEYMAPEQLMGEEVDLRVDVYATGCVLFECLAGQKVHNTTSIMGLVAKQSLKQAPDVTPLSGIPPQIVAVIGRALAPERNERWQTAAEMREALDAADAV